MHLIMAAMGVGSQHPPGIPYYGDEIFNAT